jgi:hypothetical protein
MPFAVLSLPEHQYDVLRSESLTGGHNVVEHVGAYLE